MRELGLELEKSQSILLKAEFPMAAEALKGDEATLGCVLGIQGSLFSKIPYKKECVLTHSPST